MRIILPKSFVPLEAINGPFFYLAGPVLGGDGWQQDACWMLDRKLKEFYAVVPCRWLQGSPMFPFNVQGRQDQFDRQTHWEHFYLQAVAARGCIVFWLPGESKRNPRQDGSPYARDTYGELGYWRAKLSHNPAIRLVVGAEEGFLGRSQIARNFELDLPEFTIYSSLQETIEVAVNSLR